MALPTITVDLGELLGPDGDPVSLADGIVTEGARQLVSSVERDLRDEIKTEVKSQIREKIAAAIDKAFEAELYETDSYGQRRQNAKMQTMSELIIKQTHDYLAERVNKEGRTDYGDRTMTRAQWIALSAAQQFVESEMKPEIAAAKAEVKKQIGSKLSDAFKEALKKSVECVC